MMSSNHKQQIKIKHAGNHIRHCNNITLVKIQNVGVNIIISEMKVDVESITRYYSTWSACIRFALGFGSSALPEWSLYMQRDLNER